MENKISKATRQLIFDFLKAEKIKWFGSSDDISFLEKIFDLENLPSTDGRYSNVKGDIFQHRQNNADWEDDWIFTDSRFNLLNCEDSIYCKFIEEILNPLIRAENEIDSIISFANDALKRDKYLIVKKEKIGGKQFYQILPLKWVESIKDIEFRVVRGNTPPAYYINEPSRLILKWDNWNDYGYETLFYLDYVDENKKVHSIGAVKIAFIADKPKADEKPLSTRNVLEAVFSELPSNFFSLGQSPDYYQNLLSLGKPIYTTVLEKLRDVVFNEEVLKSFRETEPFKVSLIRGSEAEKAFGESGELFKLEYRKFEDTLNFTFTTRVKNADNEHAVTFDFRKGALPHRIHVLIGKNGTGKTMFLNNLSNALSGISGEKLKSEFGTFDTKPSFRKIITFSYSAFDTFNTSTQNSLGYKYCGIRKDDNELFSRKELKSKFVNSIRQLKSKGRVHDWNQGMLKLLNIPEIVNEDFDEGVWSDRYDLLSSGQTIICTLLAETLAFIEKESLILIDEPELHLHPNSLIGFINTLYFILNSYDSYAVLATHSPIVVKEIPSKYINVFRRSDNSPYIQTLNFETFGENYSVIAQEIFGLIESDHIYKKVLEELYKETLSIDEVKKLFNGNLSANAEIYLNVLKNNHEKD